MNAYEDRGRHGGYHWWLATRRPSVQSLLGRHFSLVCAAELIKRSERESDWRLCFKCTKRSISVTSLYTDITGLGTMEYCVAVIQSRTAEWHWERVITENQCHHCCLHSKQQRGIFNQIGTSKVTLKAVGNRRGDLATLVQRLTHYRWISQRVFYLVRYQSFSIQIWLNQFFSITLILYFV